jgi:hypothetical protein
MPRIRQENFRYEAVTLGEAVDISVFDRVGKRGNQGNAYLSTSGERGEFLFLEGGAIGDVVTVAYLNGTGGQVGLKLVGYGQKGTHLEIGASGVIQGSSTGVGSELAETDLGVVIGDFTEGSIAECDLYRI